MLHNITAGRRQKRLLLALSFIIFHLSFCAAQSIIIGGNVYGGGNVGEVKGSTKVTVRDGDLQQVYGGARMANVGGSTFVHIDGENASNDIFIMDVYGGNDITGTIGQSKDVVTTVPDELKNIKKVPADDEDTTKNAIDNSWKTFVLTTPCATKKTVTVPVSGKSLTADDKMMVVGSLFGGSNGDYDYVNETESDGITPNLYCGLTPPNISKTYLEIRGGSICHVYGGGNNATVDSATVINIDNSSDDLEKAAIVYAQKNSKSQQEVIKAFQDKVKMSTFQSVLTSYAFNHARIYGGNNKATMAIMPKWNIQKGIIRDLYSGGNEGDMIYKNGLLLEINPTYANRNSLFINNVYGGCRRADVRPRELITSGVGAGTYRDVETSKLPGYSFPATFSARTLIAGGNITNVYGGNDISGHVFGGNAVGIRTSISGDVYGGGNGSYAYTDNPALGTDKEYEDYYYSIEEVKKKEKEHNPSFVAPEGFSSVDALNLFRPNAEQVSIRLWGESTANPTIIGGSVYVGGNSATLKKREGQTGNITELKISSNVIANQVFLGNNGENMVTKKDDEGNVIATCPISIMRGPQNGKQYSSIKFENPDTFAVYMDGCASTIIPRVVFDNTQNDDPADYVPYTSYIGSFFCGGNVGSMKTDGLTTLDFNKEVVIFDKLVGGCNKAYVPAVDGYNAAFEGGLIGAPDTEGNSLQLNLDGVKLQPKRWRISGVDDSAPETYPTQLVWNTVKNLHDENGNPVPIAYNNSNWAEGETSDDIALHSTMWRRFLGGNVYGGCYESGYVNGNVIININSTLVDREGEHGVFDTATPKKTKNDPEADPEILYDHEDYDITTVRSGVILGEQGMDALGTALNVFGGGYGKGSEIKGSTTINLNRGYTFQIFGGGEQGSIGKGTRANDGTLSYDTNSDDKVDAADYNAQYSTTINVNGLRAGCSKEDWDKLSAEEREKIPECEFIYGGGFEGLICGDTHINLGNGRVFNTFAGSCDADVLGHTETYLGQWTDKDGNTMTGFPWVRDHIYGGNDLGGTIHGSKDFTDHVSSAETLALVHGVTTTTTTPDGGGDPITTTTSPVLTASAYTEFIQGRVANIFGGCYGDYDYDDDPEYKDITNKPYLDNAFVNIRPTNATDVSKNSEISQVYGAGQGHSQGENINGNREGDLMQSRSYVLIDIPEGMTNFNATDVFGAGSNDGLGMKYNTQEPETLPEGFTLDKASAIVDLIKGKIHNAHGGSYNEGIVRRTVINVPEGSTINVNNIFGGGYGTNINIPCDVYEAHVNYHSDNATVRGNIYGGNNNADRTLYGQVNVTTPVWQDKSTNYLASIYGAGYGENTWSQYTEVNLLPGARVYQVYGGGEKGLVYNKETIDRWKELESSTLDIRLHNYEDLGLDDPLVHETALGGKYNTNVHIHKGAFVSRWAYGGGLGDANIPNSGDVFGTTYIDLLGGSVGRDIYAAGSAGGVLDGKEAKNFTASATAYIAGGTVRNVFGGGWKGNVGKHTKKNAEDKEVSANIDDDATNDILGETHVVIGIRKDQTDENRIADIAKVKAPGTPEATLADYGYYCGVPTIERNAYGGGEGGAVYGTSHLTLNNGYVGYVYNTTTGQYDEKLDDETWYEEGQYAGDGRLTDCGNLFGGGYDVLSSVDYSNVTMWGGTVRNSMHGGGEIATIGRGTVTASGPANSVRILNDIYKAGKTHVEMYNGHVKRNVFGGGKGYNILNFGTTGTLYMDGFVFGQTETYIHGGEIGTEEGLADGYGNVFGGGDVGFVYSRGYKNSSSRNTPTGSPGHYYYYHSTYKCVTAYGKYQKDDIIDEVAYNWLSADDKANWTLNETSLTEDCKVVVAPMLQKTSNYTYVDTDVLNTLPKKDKVKKEWPEEWNAYITEDTDGERGIIIHNAVFAGGNVSTNSDTHYADAVTVYGNATATLYDVYHRDFITVGTEHTGGLYGGGNLSKVDGYRELNITNYGTDYYGLESQISIDEYRTLSSRERAYFQLKYQCKAEVTIGDVKYLKDQIILESEYLKLLEKYGDTARNAFTPYGFCSIYAGRLLNTIQRADFCGVFGSRMVMQGAKDRVAEVGEDIDYTINRVGEVSLNQRRSTAGDINTEDANHGNYFGIYSLVNYMGNLTSDVKFGDPYVGKDSVEVADGTTFYSYKKDRYTSSERNYGYSLNKVALASGVFLELVNEKTELNPDKEKDYGYVTGVVELDLINVKKDHVGGGFVYAKNEHRVPKYYPNKSNVLLSSYNQPIFIEPGVGEVVDTAHTYRRYRYATPEQEKADGIPAEKRDPRWADDQWTESAGAFVISGDDEKVYQTMPYETSGNFIHPKKRIVDDCYPTNNSYIIKSDNFSPAHYWYIKGDVYIYDVKVSAYTGSANAYSKEVHLPLTITAASNGQLQLLNVKPNLYAYYTDVDGAKKKIGTKDQNGKPVDKVWVNNDNDDYELNQPITWWDWHQMSYKDRQYFVTQTYVNCVPCTVNGKLYAAEEYVMDETDFTAFQNSNPDIRDAEGNIFENESHEDIGLSYVFRSSNNISHDTGYALTFDMSSPKVWDDYYTVENPSTHSGLTKTISKEDYENLSAANQNAYIEGPTYTPKTTGTYGERQISVGEIISFDDVNNNNTTGAGAATVEPAYVATESVTYNYTYTENEETKTISKTVNPGTGIPQSEYNSLTPSEKAAFAPAVVCTNTLKLEEGVYLGIGELMTKTDSTNYVNNSKYSSLVEEIKKSLAPAYICSEAGGFGGQIFTKGINYNVLKAWCSLPANDRIDNSGDKFTFNYDALELLNDKDYLVVNMGDAKVENPSTKRTERAYHEPYTKKVGVEYVAVNGADTLTNRQFEDLRNDKRHYTRVPVKADGETIYFANDNFIYDGVPYGMGQIVDEDVKTANPSHVDAVVFPSGATVRYYCYENYDGGNKGDIISESDYSKLTNEQVGYTIQGKEPTGVTTLYVSKESDAYDVTAERIYTVLYQYTYYEDEEEGGIKLTNELHVVNIHLDLESGEPTIGPLYPPATVLPASTVGLKAPEVTPGLYEPYTSGWELFGNETDAWNHRNGLPFVNNETPVYWYQNQKYYVAFYSKTYLGKTYSNPVPLSVANYHHLDQVMKDKQHHMYVDHPLVDRDSKIYIDNRECESDATKSELDLLKDFFDLSLQAAVANDGELKGHQLLNNHVRAGRNLEFFLQSDVSPKKYTTWTSIGNNNDKGDTGECFQGTLHGDGHTIIGLSSSLFNHLCGDVYNLGVTGSFTGAGIAETGDGYVENCWVQTTAPNDQEATGHLQKGTGHYAVFANPSRDGDAKGDVQVVNCYYPVSNEYDVPASDTHGKATPMPDRTFYNGEVAYDLNGFYLNKRYYHGTSLSTGTTYNYLDINPDGSLSATMSTGYYPAEYAVYEPDINNLKGEKGPNMGYVESRFYDGDFRYSGGTIPENSNIRKRTVTVGLDEVDYYTPIWPDDYLFFGQKLTYGYDDDHAHQPTPSAINRSGERVLADADGNRVFRAPAYYRSGNMNVAHFNAAAIFAQTKKGATDVVAYKNMTAIDFTGHNDVSQGYQSGTITTAPYSAMTEGAFYPPLLDDGGLTSFRNVDLTRNLLAYTGTTAPANPSTNDVVSAALGEKPYEEDNDKYHNVPVWDSSAYPVYGHWVQYDGTAYKAQRDHLLVDKQDFNAPIQYTFAADNRMWHQRQPDNYVGKKKPDDTFIANTAGWEGVSLPFTAELVTTDTKGEITHFYGSSKTATNSASKIGHEYWLREFKGNVQLKSGETKVYTADFNYPDANAGDGNKDYTNTFLWDYYYSLNAGQDANADIYQEKDENNNYYRYGRRHENYPRLANGKPYIIGFPGERYYEFDLSGSFEPVTTMRPYPAKLNKQVITFASKTGATIHVSDTEMEGVTPDECKYTFKPSYLNNPDVPSGQHAFLLNAEGSSYKETAASTASGYAFRPYFLAAYPSSAREATRSIVFGNGLVEEPQGSVESVDGRLHAYAGKHKIVVSSNMKVEADVRIVNTAGQTLTTFTLQPGEAIETPIRHSGVYIVQSVKGEYTRKLAVK